METAHRATIHRSASLSVRWGYVIGEAACQGWRTARIALKRPLASEPSTTERRNCRSGRTDRAAAHVIGIVRVARPGPFRPRLEDAECRARSRRYATLGAAAFRTPRLNILGHLHGPRCPAQAPMWCCVAQLSASEIRVCSHSHWRAGSICICVGLRRTTRLSEPVAFPLTISETGEFGPSRPSTSRWRWHGRQERKEEARRER